MSGAATRSTGSGSGCGLEVGAPSSDIAAGSAGAASPRRGRPYDSLTGQSGFGYVLRTGRRRRSAGVTVIAAERRAGAPAGRARVGIVAGREMGGAVARNRAKRRIREALATAALRDGTDYVVIARPQANEAPFEELVRWLAAALADLEPRS